MTITDLSGRWEVCLDESKADALPTKYPDRISLPDSTSNRAIIPSKSPCRVTSLSFTHQMQG